MSREQLTEYFQPDRVQRAVLSPDGDHVGYVVTEQDSVSVVLRQVEFPDVKTAVRVDLLARAPGRVEVKYLGWASRDWLVYLVALPDREQTWSEELHAIDVRDFKNRLLLKSGEVRYILPTEPLPSFRPVPGINPDHVVKTPDVAPESTDPDTRMAMREAEAQLSRTPKLRNDFTFPRHLRVLACDVHAPVVWLEANGASSTDAEVYLISAERRAVTSIGRWPGGEHFLYDRIAKPRIKETTRAVFSRRRSFSVLDSESEPVWRSLDEYLGGEAGFSHDDGSDYFGPRTFPLTFDADPNVLYVASNLGSNYLRLRRLDLEARRMSDLELGDVACDLAAPSDAFTDSGLVFDVKGRLAGARVPGMPGTTRWLSAGGRELQRQVESFFPGRTVDVLGWNDSGTRALLMTSGPSDPGRYFIFHPGERPRAVELARRKRLTTDTLAVTRLFDFSTAAGVRVCGSVTLPDAPRRRPPPLVVLCRDIPGPGLIGTTYEPAAHALAAMGFMVLEVNYRGRAGLGTAHREAVRQGFDRVPLEDIRAAMAYVRRLEPFDPRRVALFGEGFGGYLALRALELYPNEFRAAVVANAPVELRSWAANERVGTLTSGGSAAGRRAFFAADSAVLAAAPSLATGGALRQRVLVLRFREDKTAAAVRSALKGRRCDVDTTDLSAAVEGRDPRALGAAFARIGDFLNGALFDYRVDVGKEEPVP